MRWVEKNCAFTNTHASCVCVCVCVCVFACTCARVHTFSLWCVVCSTWACAHTCVCVFVCVCVCRGRGRGGVHIKCGFTLGRVHIKLTTLHCSAMCCTGLYVLSCHRQLTPHHSASYTHPCSLHSLLYVCVCVCACMIHNFNMLCSYNIYHNMIW